MKDFRIEDLEELCQQENWTYSGSRERTEEVLEERVASLERKIIKILENVGPMEVKKMEYTGKMRWIIQTLQP